MEEFPREFLKEFPEEIPKEMLGKKLCNILHKFHQELLEKKSENIVRRILEKKNI